MSLSFDFVPHCAGLAELLNHKSSNYNQEILSTSGKCRKGIEKSMKKYLDHDERIKKLQQMVDGVCRKIKSGKLTLGEAKKEVALVRLKAEKLIPFEMDKFDLIYMARFKRLIEQFLLPKLKK